VAPDSLNRLPAVKPLAKPIRMPATNATAATSQIRTYGGRAVFVGPGSGAAYAPNSARPAG
jgi:hypothetical protein